MTPRVDHPHSAAETGSVLGIDIGGSGSRVALAELTVDSLGASDGADAASANPRQLLTGPRVQVGASGSSVPQLVQTLIDLAGSAWPQRMRSVCSIGIGATGIASLVDDPSDLAARLSTQCGIPVAVAVDAVTAHLGALRGEGGAAAVLGTGAVAIGHPGPDSAGVFSPRWRRVDGWGHLLGDRGGGAWLGRNGLELALRDYDGSHPARSGPTGAGLLRAAEERFGSPATWPGQLYTREDRAGLLAEFARDVVELAHAGDAAAAELVTWAGREAAQSALAALEDDCPPQVVLTGGLARAGGLLLEGFSARVADHRRAIAIRKPAGDPLDGALILARLGAAGRLIPQEGVLWI